ncbi:hypothetical protein GQ55_1G438400 [Panicum hallii var. hallii]|uniref:Uncharacterized protein n=1 Tax=Panicum hallii var. hallii TaxID=1504633 RepID=A0A2T7FDV4_9POAL|nr:hypothetical protein GQ55_1G438400 [Panicum hallii var. hallii]
MPRTNAQAIDHETRGKTATHHRHSLSHLIHCHVKGAHGNLGDQSPLATSAVPVPVQEPIIAGEAQVPAGGPSKFHVNPSISETGPDSERRHFAECSSIWCRPQSWAHIQIQHLLVPG